MSSSYIRLKLGACAVYHCRGNAVDSSAARRVVLCGIRKHLAVVWVRHDHLDVFLKEDSTELFERNLCGVVVPSNDGWNWPRLFE